MTLCSLLTIASARAGDWPQILGPNRNGIATGERVPPNPLRGEDGQPLAFEKRLGV